MKWKKTICALLISVTTLLFSGCGEFLSAPKSAYDIAVENGFVGTEEEWLESLKGQDGKDGKDGTDGKDGVDGTHGADGKDGVSPTIDEIYESWVEKGNVGSFNDFLREYLQLDGAVADDYTEIIAHNMMSTVLIAARFTGEDQLPDYSTGSGVIVDLNKAEGDATIITNYHVVYDKEQAGTDKIAQQIGVYLYGGVPMTDQSGLLTGFGYMEATYVGGSMQYDVAVLRIRNDETLKQSYAEEAVLGDSDKVVLGEKVHVIGNAEGMGLSVTAGVISVKSESLTMTAADGATEVSFTVMRTDAAINHGNSGGGLYDARGRLVGIPSAKTVDTSVEAMGYALHINTVMAVANNIIENGGEGKKALLGITIEVVEMKAVLDEATGLLEIVETIQIKEKTTGSAGSELEVGDVLVSVQVNEKVINVTQRHHLLNALLDVRMGDTIVLTVLRGGVETPITITFSKDAYFVKI